MEALNEYANNGVAMASTDGDKKPTKPTKPKPIEPDPIFGPSGFSLK